MPYTCEVCGRVTEEKYGSGRFCRSECAKKYSSMKSLEKLRAKQAGVADKPADVTPGQIIQHATNPPVIAAEPAFTEEQIRVEVVSAPPIMTASVPPIVTTSVPPVVTVTSVWDARPMPTNMPSTVTNMSPLPTNIPITPTVPDSSMRKPSHDDNAAHTPTNPTANTTPTAANAKDSVGNGAANPVRGQYQKRGRTREQQLKRQWGDRNEVIQEIARQFQPRWDMWRI